MPIAAFPAFLLSHLHANWLRVTIPSRLSKATYLAPTASPLTTSSTFSRHALFSPHAPLCRPLKFQFIQRICAVARAE
ncbi:hypothetical protein B0H13DRAFT_2046320 [Mycena leptocephala]|nr:hypothetical protein B0H13DRAFT_2046320 [Mycena leptocephala]